MKVCKNCHNSFTPTNPHNHNAKFCTVECREKFYDATMPCRQKAYIDAYNHSRYNQKARDKFQCPFCKGWYVALLHHVWQRHDMSGDRYKEYFGLDRKTSLIPRWLKELKADWTFRSGVIKNFKKGVATRFVKGDKRAGRYERRLQTVLRLKKIRVHLSD